MKLQGLNLEEGYDNLMQDTIQIDNKTIEWLVVQRGFEIPSLILLLKRKV